MYKKNKKKQKKQKKQAQKKQEQKKPFFYISNLKRSIYFCVKVGRNHRRDANHLPLLHNSEKCFGTRSIDKFSFRISTRRIILVVEGRECDKQIDYFRAIRAGTELYRS